jgi:transposase
MAVTRDGIPVRCWAFPGNTAGQKIIRKVKDDLGGWNLHRLIWVADRGFASATNRAYLSRGGGGSVRFLTLPPAATPGTTP